MAHVVLGSYLERRCASSMGGDLYVDCCTGTSLVGAGCVLTSQPFAQAGGGIGLQSFGRPGEHADSIPKLRGDVSTEDPVQRGDLPLPQ